MFFDERGSAIVGKPAEKLIKQYTRSETPPEISALIGEKITVVVKVMPPKADKADKDPTFEILNIKKRHGKDFITCGFKREQNQAVFSATSSYSVNLPPLIPIQHTEEEDKPSGSHLISPHDFQLMDIDQTGLVNELNLSHNTAFQRMNDHEKEVSDDGEKSAPLSKKPRNKD
ncbi:hypothetical protein BS78_06G244300 [Paspalum vaginatum]|nr:hypothetical protein BS78_06G244300 [Paspalum vaginatum]